MDATNLIEDVIDREGGYVDHPADRGGPTCFGITQAVARAEGYDGPIRELPRSFAATLYRRRYWQAPAFDRVALRAPALAAELFDTGVNMGPAVAATFLQRVLNALNREQRDWADIMVDGNIGAKTLHALDTLLATRGPAAETVLIRAINALQGERYLRLAELRPANEAFLYGWLAHRAG